jgi:hypothetical protein
MNDMMKKPIYVFNGDADGICSLIQLHLYEGDQNAQLVTGVKRDIKLLSKIGSGRECDITVLDISYDKNQFEVNRLLQDGASIRYIDHHQADSLVSHPRLQTHIDLRSEVCTSLLVNELLSGSFLKWALCGTYGDNLSNVADDLGQQAGYELSELEAIKRLGILINYNGYGADLSDLYFHPEQLFHALKKYKEPLEFVENDKKTYHLLSDGYEQDLDKALNAPRIHETTNTTVIELPNNQWARRVSGVFGNELANLNPNKAHAIIIQQADLNYMVSVRAPLVNRHGADELVSKFPTGGGRKAAAGINALPTDLLSKFIDEFEAQYTLEN